MFIADFEEISDSTWYQPFVRRVQSPSFDGKNGLEFSSETLKNILLSCSSNSQPILKCEVFAHEHASIS